MLPPLIVAECLTRGIGLIAITDHNASANVAAVQDAARGSGLVVLPGMELQTREDIHILCLFDTLEQIRSWQQIVDRSLPNQHHYLGSFGDQFVVDASGDFIGRETRPLLVSTDLSVAETWQKVDALGGLAIPAHVNRTPNGLFATLGHIPEEIPFPALEISSQITPDLARQNFPQINGYTFIQSGDAHRLDDLLGLIEFKFENPSIDEMKKAFRGEGSRSVNIFSIA
jgi:hypothetical protein